MRLKEINIQSIMWEHLKRYLQVDYVFHNLYHFYDTSNEIDMVYYDEGLFVEMEIKSNRADFHEERLKVTKHELLRTRDETCPNKFYYVIPEGEITKDQIPEYAGFIEIKFLKDGGYKTRIIKRAPLLHNKRFDVKDLFDKIYYKYDKQFSKEFYIVREATKKQIQKENGYEGTLVKRSKKRKNVKKPSLKAGSRLTTRSKTRAPSKLKRATKRFNNKNKKF